MCVYACEYDIWLQDHIRAPIIDGIVLIENMNIVKELLI